MSSVALSTHCSYCEQQRRGIYLFWCLFCACGTWACSCNVDCLSFHTATFAIYQEDWADGRRRVNKIDWKAVVRRTVGEEAATACEDAFVGVQQFLFACFVCVLVSWAWDWSQGGRGPVRLDNINTFLDKHFFIIAPLLVVGTCPNFYLFK